MGLKRFINIIGSYPSDGRKVGSGIEKIIVQNKRSYHSFGKRRVVTLLALGSPIVQETKRTVFFFFSS